jgi:hypothetical protein
MPDLTAITLESAAHIIQLALTPVFLLSGIAALLNVFANRLGRVADQTDRLASDPQGDVRDRRLRSLRLRSTLLYWAVVLAGLGGALTCGAVLVLFLGGVGGSAVGYVLFSLFGGAILLTMGSLFFHVIEILLAASRVRRQVDHSVRGGRRSQ